MPEKIMLVTWDEGAHLSKSRQTPGSYSPLTRDQDHVLGQVTLSDVDDQEDHDDESGLPSAKVVAAVVGLIAAAKAAPYVKQWLTDTAVPAAKASRDRLAAALGRRDRAGHALSEVDEPTVAESTDLAERVDSPSVSMSSAEWWDHFRLMLLAGAVQDEQWRLLATARVDDGDLLEVQQKMQTLTAQQRTEAIRAALDSSRPVSGRAGDDLLQVLTRDLVDDSARPTQLNE